MEMNNGLAICKNGVTEVTSDRVTRFVLSVYGYRVRINSSPLFFVKFRHPLRRVSFAPLYRLISRSKPRLRRVSRTVDATRSQIVDLVRSLFRF